MDIKSIVRAFRYNELQQKSDRNPEARRPPTIKFLGIAVAVGAVALGFGIIVMHYEPADVTAGHGLSEPTPTISSSPSLGNSTAAPTTSVASHPAAQRAPH